MEPRFDKDIELLKLTLLAEDYRSDYLTGLGFHFTAMITALAIELTVSLQSPPWRNLELFSILAVFTIGLFGGLAYDRVVIPYRGRLSRLNTLIKTVQAGNPIPDLDELLKQSSGTDEKHVVGDISGKSPTQVQGEATEQSETPLTDKRDTEAETLRFYWDYRRSILNTMLALLFSAFVAAATILNAQVVSPVTRLSPYLEDALLLLLMLVIFYYIARVGVGLKKLVIRTDSLLKKIGSGASTPSLRDLCEVKSEPASAWKELTLNIGMTGIIALIVGAIIFLFLAL